VKRGADNIVEETAEFRKTREKIIEIQWVKKGGWKYDGIIKVHGEKEEDQWNAEKMIWGRCMY
jgi:hypothetical protein